jgi:hypothetical protein
VRNLLCTHDSTPSWQQEIPADGFRAGSALSTALGEERTVHAVVMNAAASGNDYPRECQIHTSMDGKNWLGPVGAGKGSGAVTKIAVLPMKARHVRITQTGSHDSNWWSMYDLQILGE